jgi:hypothetical protein
VSRLIHLGAELGHVHVELLAATGAPFTYDTAVKRSGAASYKFSVSGAGATALYNFAGAVGTRVWVTAWFYLPAATGLPAAGVRVLGFSASSGGQFASAMIRADGKIRLQNQANAQVGSESVAAAQVDTWHRLDLGLEIEAGSTDFVELRFDGVTVATSSVQALSDAAPTRLHFGFIENPGTEVIHFDDIILNDDTGSVNNTWPGDERVVALLPTADSARGANWLGGADGTTNLWDALDNIPPVGVATASATNTSQIENAASTIVEEYDATMTTYTAAGVGGNDTVTAIYGVWEAGSSSTTGSDTIAGEVESNPAIAEASSSVDFVTGTYPTGWTRGQTAMAENPTVAKGTAPVMSVRKAVATTRVHQVCLMAMLVSYAVGPAGTRYRAII